MGLFEGIPGRRSENGTTSRGWEVLTQKTPEQQKAERQQRKLIAAFIMGENGHANPDSLRAEDYIVTDEQRGYVVGCIANGVINASTEHELIDSIQGPMDVGNPLESQDGKTMHELKIAAYFGDGNFDNWQSVNRNTGNNFILKFPNPMDFEGASNALLEEIRKHNGDAKRDEYAQDMEIFKHRMYGKKQEYWEQMKVLNAEAEALKQQ